MRLVVLDLNALIGMQKPEQRVRLEPILADRSNLLMVTDQTFLEACGHGRECLEDILRPLVPYRDRVRAGRRHSELFQIEAATRRPVTRQDLKATSDRTRNLQDALAALESGQSGLQSFWDDAEVATELQRRLSPEATASLIRDRVTSLQESIAEWSRREPPRAKGEWSLKRKMRHDVYDAGRVELCMKLAVGLTADHLIQDGVHWVVAKHLANVDSFSLRHELAYWLRCLHLIHDDRLGSWDRAGTAGKLVNEHFDIEYVAMASMADLAACEDAASRDTLAMMELALDLHFKRHGPVARAVP